VIKKEMNWKIGDGKSDELETRWWEKVIKLEKSGCNVEKGDELEKG